MRAGEITAGAEDCHRDSREDRRKGEPDFERRPREDERWGRVAPERVGDEAATLDEVARDADVVGGVLGSWERDGGRGDRPHDHGDREDAERAQPRLARAHCVSPVVGGRVQRGSPAVVQMGKSATRTGASVGDVVPAPSSVSRQTGGPTHGGSLPRSSGSTDGTASSRSRTSQRMSYARATCSTAGSGSFTRTTPGRPVAYREPAASIDISRSVPAAPCVSSARSTAAIRSRLASHVPWTASAPAYPTMAVPITAVVVKRNVAAWTFQRGRRAATPATAAATPSNARM